MTTGSSSGSAISGTIRSRARVWMASAPTSVPTTAIPTSASSEHGEQLGQRLPGGGPSSSTAKAGHRDELDGDEEARAARRLGDEQRRAVDRREQEAVEAALLVLGDEQAVDAEHGGEQQRHPQHAGGEVALQRGRGRARSGRARTSRRRRASIAGTDSRVRSSSRRSLRSERGDRRASRVEPPDVLDADLGGGGEERLAPAAQPEHQVGVGEARSTSWEMSTRAGPAWRPISGATARAPPGSRLASGSSSSSSSGSCSTARQIATRWAMPRESVRDRVVGARGQADALEQLVDARRRRRRAAARGSAGSRAR